MPDRGCCVAAMPHHRDDDPRGRIPFPVQRGGDRSGPQRGAHQPEDWGYRFTVGRYAAVGGAPFLCRQSEEFASFLSRKSYRGFVASQIRASLFGPRHSVGDDCGCQLHGLGMFKSAMLAAGAMLLTRCCTSTQARLSVEWKVILTVAAAFALGTAVEKSGLAAAISQTVTALSRGKSHDQPGGNLRWHATSY